MHIIHMHISAPLHPLHLSAPGINKEDQQVALLDRLDLEELITSPHISAPGINKEDLQVALLDLLDLEEV